MTNAGDAPMHDAWTDARRRRRLTDFVVAAGIIAFFPALVLFLWSIGWYADLSDPAGPSGVRLGAVAKVEHAPNVVYVAAMPFGLKAQPFLVTSDTLVLVGHKEGGFGDLATGERVRVDYDMQGGVRRAVCVELVRGAPSGRTCPREAMPRQVREAPAAGAASIRFDDMPATRLQPAAPAGPRS